MKLETEITSQNSFTNQQSTVFGLADTTEMLQAGIKQAKDGNRAEARMLLSQVTESEPENETAWLWLASISEYPEELLVFLQNVLTINPKNARALEWTQATKSMLAKSFVERGINATRENRREFANQCFLQALMHDTQNEMAWLWLASNSDSPEEKTSHLQKVLSINPENETALASLKSVKHEMLQSLLKKANFAAISGERETARELLEEAMQNAPELEEAWILKAYLADDSYEKITCYEKILDLNPENEAAQAGLASQKVLLQKSIEQKSNAAMLQEVLESPAGNFSNTDEAIELSDDVPSLEQISASLDLLDEQSVAAPAEFSAPNSDSESHTSRNFIPESFESPTADLDVNFVKEIESRESFSEDSAGDTTVDARASAAADEFQGFDVSGFEDSSSFEEADDFFEIEVSRDEEAEFASSDALEFSVTENSAASSESADDLIPANFETSVSSAFADAGTAENAASSFPTDSPEEEEEEEAQIARLGENEKAFHADKAVEEQNSASGVDKATLHEESVACPFCFVTNEPQAIVCSSCRTMLSLSDLEMLLSHTEARPEVLEMAIEDLEAEKSSRGLNAVELTNLAIAHLNARNLRKGLSCLQEAAQLTPNDVVLAAKVNFLAIRLSEIEAHDSKMEGAEPKSLTVMVVDDSPTVRKLISSKLEKCGHTVVSAADGMEALEHIKEVVPDLVLLDIMMPQMDGYQVCKLIRNNESTKDVPVIMISGKDGFFDKVRGRMAGTSGFISKPFGPETLMKTIETYVG